MHRFVALVWDTREKDLRRRAELISARLQNCLPLWSYAFKCHGLHVLHSDGYLTAPSHYPLNPGFGVVLGTLFEDQRVNHSAANTVATIGETAARRIADSCGRTLISEYWGRYVAFVRPENEATTYIIRDPSGQFGCYTWILDGIRLYFSRLQDLVEAKILSTSVNWDYLAAQFLKVELTNGKTAFQNVQEILAGECYAQRGRDIHRSFYWDPRALCHSNVINDFRRASEEIRTTAQYCIGMWTRIHPRITHELSGGQDSAMVLACIVRSATQPHVTCLNYYTDDSNGDERVYARAAAKMAGCKLIEIRMDSEVPLQTLLPSLELTAKPDWALLGQSMRTLAAHVIEENGSSAFTSGQGGDHLFFNDASPSIAADYLWLNRMDRRSLSIGLASAHLSRKSFWHVAKLAILQGLLRIEAREALKHVPPSFLDANAILSLTADALAHPWESRDTNAPPAKSRQIASLAKLLHRFPAVNQCGKALVLHPLMSQPLMEVCLRTPTFILTNYARATRAAARAAFNGGVPPAILNREDKGTTSNHFARMYANNFRFIRELVLDGHLSKASFIDRNRLNAFLTISRFENTANTFPLLQLIATEAWLTGAMRCSEQRLA